jgi:hypothetical protein
MNNLYHNPWVNVLTRSFLILLIVLSGDTIAAYAQTQPQQPQFYNQPQLTKRLQLRDTRDSLANQKRFGRAAIELGFAELVPWTVDRYVRKVDYTNISWKTVSHNLNPGNWAWDNDNFQTNQFGHPYHGSYFFSAFRTNGYSFWQSVPAAFAGSYLWETFAENQAPAPNDFINTSFGGIVLGETTYRLSNKIVNNQARGFKRQASEVVALLVNPMNGLNRILDGKWGKVSHNTLEVDSSKVNAEFDLGYRAFNNDLQGRGSTHHGGWYGSAKLLYGTPYEHFSKPFTNINITAEFGKDDSTSLNVVSAYGSLTGWQLNNGEVIKQLLILSANYDYIHNVAFFYGGQSVKFNLYSEFDVSKKIKLNTTLGAGPVLLAAVPDVYLYQGRNYDYGPGFAINGGGRLGLMNKLFLGINYRGGWVKTLSGNASHYFLHAVTSEVSYMLVDNVSLAVEPGYFTLRGNYKTKPDVINNYPYLRASVRYALNLK